MILDLYYKKKMPEYYENIEKQNIESQRRRDIRNYSNNCSFIDDDIRKSIVAEFSDK
jgi:hypothetical protein